MRPRLAIVASHPIQYQAPWFRALAGHPALELEVLFCHSANAMDQANAGFGVSFEWDVPLLEGYPHHFVPNVSRRPNLERFDGLDSPMLARLIRRRRYDAVLVNGWYYKSAWQTIWACWQTGTPVLVRSDSHRRTPRSALRTSLKWPVYRALIPRFDGCLSVGSLSREYFLHYGADPNRVFVVPHAVDPVRFPSCLEDPTGRRTRARQRWGFSEATSAILFAGKFIDKKRPMDFVRGVDLASRRDAKLVGLMVGDGPLRAACQAYAIQRCAPIVFAGFLNQTQMSDAYAAADVLVLASDGGETWGLVANEAMASGLPCIVTDQVGCGPDMVVRGETGDVYPMGDVRALSTLLSMFSSRGEAEVRRMGRAALRMARDFTPQTAADATVRAVMSVLELGQ